ncbi:MAG: RNA-binding protein [Alphaproteobacteria bacterium]|nr:MAG: RNA-binding protein [Alphaproteobacteria bacterium]
MPRGPKGEKRPADVIGNAVCVMRIATGEEAETLKPKNAAAVARGKSGGIKGGPARAAKLTQAEKTRIAKKAARARWK